MAFKRTYRLVHRKWPFKARRAIGWLMPLELMGLIPALVIFGISQPDLYRSDMWQIGWDNRLNSNPNMILYAYANHRPLPEIPLIWSKALTDLNVAASIISVFFLLSRLIMWIMKIWWPILGLFVNISLVALYTTSTYGQIGPDYADSRYPAYAAWYFRKGCDLAKPAGKYKTCRIAQGALVITLYLLVIYALNLGFTLWAMWPNPENDIEEKEEGEDEDEENDDDGESTHSAPKTQTVQMRNFHAPAFSPVVDSPFTPRTQAFNTLNREPIGRKDLPFRAQYA